MAVEYFNNFPNLDYANTIVKDLTRRTVLDLKSSGIPLEYYPFELNSHLRADHVAEYYYGNPAYDWTTLLANEIIDPYFGWYNSDATFEALIIEKYGDLVTAQKTIKFYRNNWADDDTILAPDYYNNTLEESLRKYWTPTYGPGLQVLGYVRQRDDITQNTNRILQYDIQSNNSSVGFTIGELVDIKETGQDTVVANGQIETSNSSMIRIRNVTGNTIANTTLIKDLVGITSGANCSVDGVQVEFENISNAEFVYYSAVTFWDWENEEREKAKNINLIGDGAIDAVALEFENKMTFDIDPETGLSTG